MSSNYVHRKNNSKQEKRTGGRILICMYVCMYVSAYDDKSRRGSPSV